MTTETAKKTLKNLERINSIFTTVQKTKTPKIIETILDFGSISIVEGFNGITIVLTIHSRILKYAVNGRKIHITTFKKHKEKITNNIYPVLLCMLEELQLCTQKKITEIKTLIKIQKK